MEKHGEQGAKEFTETVASLREQIKHQARFERLVLHPGKNSKMLNRWDFVTGTALVYTAIITPFEAAFLQATVGMDAWIDPWFLINRVLDIVFLCDMVLNFFLAFQALDSYGGLVWIVDQRRVIAHYLRGWWAFDALTIFVPLGFDLSIAFAPVDEHGNAATSSFAGDVSILRTVRIVRLAKLIRLVRASRLYARWQAKISMSTSTQTVYTCTMLLVLGSHWYACVIGMQTALHENPARTWLGTSRYGYCLDARINGSFTLDPEAAREIDEGAATAARIADSPPLDGCSTMSLTSWYIASFTWATLLITGTGGTDYYPNPYSDAETLVVMLMVVCGALLWTYILALFCDMATNSNPGVTQFRQLIDGLNGFIATHRVPKEMAQRLREYLHQQKPGQLRKYAERAIPVLSPTLQVEVLLHVHRMWLESTWFLRGLEPSCLVRLAREMVTQTLAPGEVAPMHNLYVVARGLVLYGGRVLSRGMSWGDDVILTDARYFLPFHARAMTYVDVNVLAADTLLQVLTMFPESHAVLRKKVLRLALKRHFIAAKRIIDAQQNGGVATSHEFRTKLLENLSKTNRAGLSRELPEQDGSHEEAAGAVSSVSTASPSSPARSGVRGFGRARKRRSNEKMGEDGKPTDEQNERTNIQAVALMLQDKQISQSGWESNKGGDNDAIMRHTQVMEALSVITTKIGSLEARIARVEAAPAPAPPPAAELARANTADVAPRAAPSRRRRSREHPSLPGATSCRPVDTYL